MLEDVDVAMEDVAVDVAMDVAMDVAVDVAMAVAVEAFGSLAFSKERLMIFSYSRTPIV